MSYASIDDLAARYGTEELCHLTGRTPEQGPDIAAVERALADAEAEVNSYLGTRYAVPLDPVPAIVRSITADVARYKLSDDRPLDEVKARYSQAILRVMDIASGKATLGAPWDSAAPSVAFASTKRGADRTFSTDSLWDY